MKETTKEKIRKVEEFLFGSRACICCGKECDGDNEYKLCKDCMDVIPFTKDNYCLRCGEIIKGDYDYCIKCKDRDFEFDYARSVFAYTELTAPIIFRFKYNGLRSYVYPLTKLLRDYFSTSDLIADSVVFVPMPEKRQKERGYNQSFELAKEFCKLTGLELLEVLERTKDNVKQATLNAKERSENIKGSFKVIDKNKVKDRELLIIDDVMTTGSTANECAKVLMKAGARNVQVLTLAKTVAGGIDMLIDDIK
ncbi:MAG: ComF family protein [Clostridia bacterium]|nr:ComF family protein [Clostridia bacterium]